MAVSDKASSECVAFSAIKPQRDRRQNRTRQIPMIPGWLTLGVEQRDIAAWGGGWIDELKLFQARTLCIVLKASQRHLSAKCSPKVSLVAVASCIHSLFWFPTLCRMTNEKHNTTKQNKTEQPERERQPNRAIFHQIRDRCL